MVVARFVPETFTKVVLQCFCKSCQVPNVGKDLFCNHLKMKFSEENGFLTMNFGLYPGIQKSGRPGA